MRILITGGAGFIGSHLTELLLEKNFEVVVLDNFSTSIKYSQDWILLLLEKYGEQFEFYRQDIRDLTPELFKRHGQYFGTEVIIHLAAMSRIQPSIKDPTECHDINVTGTLNLLKMARDHSIKKFIFCNVSA